MYNPFDYMVKMANTKHDTTLHADSHGQIDSSGKTHISNLLVALRKHSKPLFASMMAASILFASQRAVPPKTQQITNITIPYKAADLHKSGQAFDSFANAKRDAKTFSSNNWAAYYVASNLNNPKPTVTNVVGSWVIPTSGEGCYSKGTDPKAKLFSGSQWIGIGGVYDHSLIQLGTDTQIYEGKEQSFGWAEILPQSLVVIPGFRVAPGDEITANIVKIRSMHSKKDPNLGLWRISLNNLTQKIFAHTRIEYSSSQASAEWVVERPEQSIAGYNFLVDLPNFKSVKFVYNGPTTGNYATVNGVTGPISSFPHARLEMVNYKDIGSIELSIQGDIIELLKYKKLVPLAIPSNLSRNGMSFSVNEVACPPN